jgi:hypothetical protein
MNPLLLALAVCAQPPASTTVITPDGTAYRVTFTRVPAVAPIIGDVPPAPDEGIARAMPPPTPQAGMAIAMPPPKSTPQSVAPPIRVAAPQAAVQYQYTRPTTTAVCVQPVALDVRQPAAGVYLEQPGALDRWIGRVGLALCRHGQPRLRIAPAPVIVGLAQPTVVGPPAYPSAQQ